jgi:hypothetical protein
MLVTMVEPDIPLLHSIATRFRQTIETGDLNRLPYAFRRFPSGCCGDAALFLGTYFKEQGLGSSAYVLGSRGSGLDFHSHAWLTINGVIVDITADQFPEISDPVIVTAQSSWHEGFEQESDHEADYRIYDERTVAELGGAYRSILKALGSPVWFNQREASL